MTSPRHAQLAANGTFEHLRLGKLPPKKDPRNLQLARYLDEAVVLPLLPVIDDVIAEVPAWPMYGNDRLGDCTCAAAAHMIQAWTYANHHPFDPALVDVLDAYWATGDHTDDGRYETDVLNYWRNTGIGVGSDAHRIFAYASIDPQNLDHVRAAIYLFGGVYVGVELPISAQRQPVWDVVGDGKTGPSAPGSWGGHAIPYGAYDSYAKTFSLITWGARMDCTEAFHSAYVTEAYAVLSTDWANPVSPGKPNAFDLTTLTADLSAL